MPVLSLTIVEASKTVVIVTIESVSWKGLRCLVEVSPQLPGLMVDIRSRPAQPASSLVANIKPLVGGRANVAVKDDEHMGSAAVVVVLDAGGQVVQKSATTVGG